jgi:hypothetical protein
MSGKFDLDQSVPEMQFLQSRPVAATAFQHEARGDPRAFDPLQPA